MLKITESNQNFRAYKSLYYIKYRTKEAIRKSFYDFGKDLKQESRRLIKDPPKTGRIYDLRINGKRVLHQASAPGEAPANLTGALRKSVDYNVSQANQMTFGAGNHQTVDYAKKLELGGGNVSPRPFLIKSIEKNEKNAYERLGTHLLRELSR